MASAIKKVLTNSYANNFPTIKQKRQDSRQQLDSRTYMYVCTYTPVCLYVYIQRQVNWSGRRAGNKIELKTQNIN